jgi:hypothetical protein
MPQPDIELAFWNTAKASGSIAALESYLQSYPNGPNSAAAKQLLDKIRQEEVSRTALKRKVEEEAKRQEEERIAAEKVAAEERARREAEAKRQAVIEAAKKRAEEVALAKRQEEERIAAERQVAEERTRREAEAKRQAAAEAAKKKAEEEALAKRQREVRIAAERREAEERALREAEAKRQAAEDAAKKKAEEALAKRQEEERIADEKRAAEERIRQEAEARRQVPVEATMKKAEEKSNIVIAALPPVAEAPTTANRAVDMAAEQAKLVRALQTELKRVGCDPGEVDSVWGDKAKAALGEFARVTNVTLPSDAPSAEALQAVLAQKGRICPDVPKVSRDPPRDVANRPRVNKGSRAQPTAKAKCGYHWGGAGGAIGQQRGFPQVYSCD